MKRISILILIFSSSIFSYGESVSIDEAYVQWVKFIDKHMWVVKLYEPRIYEEIKKEVLIDLQKGSSKPELLWNIRKKQLELEAKYIPHASLEVMDQYLKFGISQLKHFIDKNDPLCVGLVSNSSQLISAYKALPPELVDSRDILEKSIIDYYDDKKVNTNEVVAEEIVSDILDDLKAQYGEKYELAFELPVPPKLNPVDTCKIYLDMGLKVSELNRAKRENILRYLFSP